MGMIIVITVLILLVILVNGWTDAPNAIAGCVSTRAASPTSALILAAVCNFTGAVIMFFISSEVAATLYNIVDLGDDPRAPEDRTQGEDADGAGADAGNHRLGDAGLPRLHHDAHQAEADDSVPDVLDGRDLRSGDERAHFRRLDDDPQDHQDRCLRIQWARRTFPPVRG